MPTPKEKKIHQGSEKKFNNTLKRMLNTPPKPHKKKPKK